MSTNSQQPTPIQTPIQPDAPTADDADVTLAAPARIGAPNHQNAASAADMDMRPTDEPAPVGQQSASSNPPRAPELENVSAPPAALVPIVHPPVPANFPPPLPVSPQAADLNGLTYRDVAAPHPPLGGQPRHPGLRSPLVQPAPLPTHVPWQVASSWGATTLSIQANTAAGASYLLWWLSGLLIYFNERHNRFVRFHAMQSILLTCVFTVYGVLVYLVAGLLYDLAAATNQYSFHRLGTVIAALSFFAILLTWLYFMIAAWTGHYIRVPVIGRYAERYAAPPAQPPQF